MFRTATQGAPPLRNPRKWSKSYNSFLSRCFDMNPDTRGSASELLSHPFIQKACDRKTLTQSIELVFLGNSLRMNGF